VLGISSGGAVYDHIPWWFCGSWVSISWVSISWGHWNREHGNELHGQWDYGVDYYRANGNDCCACDIHFNGPEYWLDRRQCGDSLRDWVCERALRPV